MLCTAQIIYVPYHIAGFPGKMSHTRNQIKITVNYLLEDVGLLSRSIVSQTIKGWDRLLQSDMFAKFLSMETVLNEWKCDEE